MIFLDISLWVAALALVLMLVGFGRFLWANTTVPEWEKAKKNWEKLGIGEKIMFVSGWIMGISVVFLVIGVGWELII